MKRTTRIICLLIAALFIAATLFSIFASVAYAEGTHPARGETVYVETDACGNVENVVSSVYISNPDKADELSDKTELTGIKNIMSNEPPVIDGKSATFKTGDDDVCYQGSYTGELPFDIEIAYKLDGKMVTPAEIAGKSGRVEIGVSVRNKLLNRMDVDGTELELYTPMTFICMMTLGEGFTAVSAEDARVSAQAGSIAIMAFLMPGMAENLDMQDSDKLHDSFTVTANAESFELGSITFIGLTGLVQESDLTGIDDIQSLLDAIDELNDASDKLYSGSKQLTSSMEDYETGVTEYAAGITTLSSSIIQAWQGMQQFTYGAAQLADGGEELAGGISQAGSSLNGVSSMLNDISNGTGFASNEVLIAKARVVFAEMLANNGDQIRAELVKVIKQAILDGGYAPTDEIAEAMANALADNIMEQLKKGDTVSDATLALIIDAMRKVIVTSAEYQNVVSQVSQFQTGLDTLLEGINQLSAALVSLGAGADSLAAGFGQLSEGSEKIRINSVLLTEAIAKLNDASEMLTSGIKQLGREGLQKIVDETEYISVSLSRKNALLSLSQSYKSLSSLEAGEDDSVQFMITTSAIKVEKPIYPEASPTPEPDIEVLTMEPQPGFFESIGNWFTQAFEDICGFFLGIFGGTQATAEGTAIE